MASHPRIRNIAVALVLTAIFYIGTVFAPYFANEDKTQFQVMLDWVSVPMLLFGLYLLGKLISDTMSAFWTGDRARSAIALYGLFLLVVSSDVLRTYGVATRNFEALSFLEHSYLYSAGVYVAFIGLWFLSHASRTPVEGVRRSRWDQVLVGLAGLVVGLIVASSKSIEPILVLVGKFFAALLGRV